MTSDPMHQKLMRRAQRDAARASRQTRIHDARRLARVELEVDALSAQVTADSILMGTSSVQQAGAISAETRRSDEATCAALAELTWTPAERLALHAMRADADGAA